MVLVTHKTTIFQTHYTLNATRTSLNKCLLSQFVKLVIIDGSLVVVNDNLGTFTALKCP